MNKNEIINLRMTIGNKKTKQRKQTNRKDRRQEAVNEDRKCSSVPQLPAAEQLWLTICTGTTI